MRIGAIATAVLLAAVPASAQVSTSAQGPASAIPTLPAEVLGNRTLKPWMVACTDVPVTVKPEPRLTIKGVHAIDTLWMAANRQEVMIGRLPGDGLAPGQRWAVRRLQGDPRTFPRDGEGFGAVRTAGWITITAVNEWNARATVDLACDAITTGDYLDVYTEPPLPTSAAEVLMPDFDERVPVLPGVDGKAIFGDGDTLSIARGTAHGVLLGARYAFYRDRRDGMPLFHVGDAVVVELGELTSKVVVVKTNDAVTLLDVAIPRRRQP
jgi:hypothetical protein